METQREKIRGRAVEIIKACQKGVRYSELVRKVHEFFPGIPLNSIRGSLWDLERAWPAEVYKPLRGIFRHVSFKGEQDRNEAAPDILSLSGAKADRAARIKEESFYQPFADWLVEDLEECSRAISLGGNRFRDKWGTPDVIGIREPRKSDIIKPPTEIVSAEIKYDAGSLITAFGQACSYKLFSHRAYIVVPKGSMEEDIARLDSLGRNFGIGLILFDQGQPASPNFEIRVRAAKHEPDMFYVNKYLELVEDELFP